MIDDTIHWQKPFSDLFQCKVEAYRSGHTKAVGMFGESDASFLKSIGYTEQEFFDFVEDFAKVGEPTLETALAVAEVRRDYFLREQKGIMSKKQVETSELPPKDQELAGIVWLPRIIAKAEAKLRGEMSSDLMYSCGGDRRFFKANGVEAAPFLRKVWEASGDREKIVSWLHSKTG